MWRQQHWQNQVVIVKTTALAEPGCHCEDHGIGRTKLLLWRPWHWQNQVVIVKTMALAEPWVNPSSLTVALLCLMIVCALMTFENGQLHHNTFLPHFIETEASREGAWNGETDRRWVSIIQELWRKLRMRLTDNNSGNYTTTDMRGHRKRGRESVCVCECVCLCVRVCVCTIDWEHNGIRIWRQRGNNSNFFIKHVPCIFLFRQNLMLEGPSKSRQNVPEQNDCTMELSNNWLTVSHRHVYGWEFSILWNVRTID